MTFWLVEAYYLVDGTTDARWGPWVVVDTQDPHEGPHSTVLERRVLDKVLEGDYLPAGGLPLSTRLKVRPLRFDEKGVADGR